MNSETWLDKASRLQRSLARSTEDDDENAARERIKIALWLRREFEENATPPRGEVVSFYAPE